MGDQKKRPKTEIKIKANQLFFYDEALSLSPAQDSLDLDEALSLSPSQVRLSFFHISLTPIRQVTEEG